MATAKNKYNNAHGFIELSSTTLPKLNIEVTKYRHQDTGAEHIHLASESVENAFMVALRTPPFDSTGVFHVLEHLITCGSEKFPVSDLFFKMTQTSVSSFMNAFTSSDWTAFPFATENRKDFDNLLDVFLDAVFFSNLNPLDFAQEGWRLEFSERDNPESELTFNGVVLNEMKGAFSSESEVIWDKLVSNLFEGSCYQYNHGGSPERITELSYEQVKTVYETHYHPSNAVFITMGNISAQQHQAVFNSQVLSRFSTQKKQISIPVCERKKAPYARQDFYPAPPQEQDGLISFHMAWLLGNNCDLKQVLEAELLSRVLLSPLIEQVMANGLSGSPSEFCGVDSERKAISLTIGFEQVREQNVGQIESLLQSSLEHFSNEVPPYEMLSAILTELAIEKMDIESEFMPHSIRLLFDVLPCAIHNEEPISLLNVADVIAELEEQIKTPEYFQGLVQQYLLNNPHRLSLTLTPDSQLAYSKQQQEIERLANIAQCLSQDEKLAILEQNQALYAKHHQSEGIEQLPELSITDINSEPTWFDGEEIAANIPTVFYQYPTNGMVYLRLFIDLPATNQQSLQHLKLLSLILPQLRTDEDPEKTPFNPQGFVKASHGITCNEDFKVQFGLSVKTLASECESAVQSLSKRLFQAQFGIIEQLEHLVSESRMRLEQNLIHGGHMLAMSAACSGFSYAENLSHRWHGLQAIKAIGELHSKIVDDKLSSAQLSNELRELHQLLISSPIKLQVIGDSLVRDNIEQDINQSFSQNNREVHLAAETQFAARSIRQVWTTHTQVSFCAMAFPTVGYEHSDAAALTVLGYYLHNGYLNSAVREQGGVYGVGANQESSVAGFRFFSSYDPNVSRTIEQFYQSVTWLLNRSDEDSQITQAIIRALAEQDKNSSAVSKLNKAFANQLVGFDITLQMAHRTAMTKVTMSDLKRVAKLYLAPEHANIVVITDHSNQMIAHELGFQHISMNA